ncbi:MAG: hypothetical protein WD648_06320 [Planctomycetaceae bacterium]
MKLQQIGELTALVSAYSHQVIDAPLGISEPAVREFWDHSRRHVGLWTTFLRNASAGHQASSRTAPHAEWDQVAPVLAEIFVMEMLSRVWCAVLTAADVQRGASHAQSFVKSVMSGQRQVRNSALSLMVNWSQEMDPRLAVVDRIRRRVERWTDALIGHLAVSHNVLDFAFEPNHALDFGRNSLGGRALSPDSPAWPLIVSGLRISFPSALPEVVHRDQVQQTVRAIVAAFPAELQQAGGPFAFLSCEPLPSDETAGVEPKPEQGMVLPFATQPQNGGLNVSQLRENFQA